MSTIRTGVAVLGLALLGATPMVAQQEGSALSHYQGGGFSDRFLGGVDLSLDLSQPVPWRVFTLSDPMRLVVDFREVDWTRAQASQLDQSDHIASLRMGPFQPGWSRLVAELSTPLIVDQAELKTASDGGGAQLRLALAKADRDEFDKHTGEPKLPGWALADPRDIKPIVRDPQAPMVIILDPGHGGIDPGAERNGINEADLMLRFAFELQDVLRRTGRYKVMMPRTEDVCVSREARVAKAREAGAGLFISLHADALKQGKAHGATVYTLSEQASDAASAALAERHNRDDLLAGLDLSGKDDRVAQVLLDLARQENTPRSRALARHVVGGIKNALGHVHKRPLQEAGFSVLKAADIPSILIEVGFLSTKEDLVNLQDPVWRAGMAAGIRDGIAEWEIEDKALSRLRRQ
jgi:N-acetylmuramoyl-L-alanine amidase